MSRTTTLRYLLFSLLALLCQVPAQAAIHVLVWDERQEKQEQAYDNFIGNEIVKQLKASTDDLELRSVALDDPEQGLKEKDLEWADVLIWWGHVRQGDVTPETVQKKIIKRLKDGKLDLIILHSAHWSTLFMEAMNERTREIAHERYPKPKGKREIEFEFVNPRGRYPPTADSLVTPAYYALRKGKSAAYVRVDMPNCCFPAVRADGKPARIIVKAPDHPIAKGLPKTFEIHASEMYNEPFHVPEPDVVIFEETWEAGEWFRSGMVWTVGKGKVFYFRPGHETYPVFKQPKVIKVLENACRWLGE